MKNRKTLKLLSAIIGIALLLCAAVAITASAEDAKTPEIFSFNVEYSEKYALMYAVDASTVAEGPVTLDLYTKEPAEGVESIRSYTVDTPETITVSGTEYSAYVFYTDGVAPKNLTQIFYARAVDSEGNKGNVVRYSVVEYMYQRLSGQQSITDNQRNLYVKSLELASAAQQVLINDKNEGTENDVTLASDYSYVFFPAGDGFVGEEAGATEGYATGIYTVGTTVYPRVAVTETGNITVTVYDDNAQIKLRKVIKNGAALQLDGDMTVITAGGEMPYSPDLTDTAGRLTFDNGESFSNYTLSFNDGKNKVETNSAAGIYSIVSAYPWFVESKVLEIKMNGGNNTYYANVQNEKATSDAKGIRYELDMMLTAPSATSTWSFNIVTGNAAATNTARAQIIANTNGALQFKDRETGDIIDLDVQANQWFRLTVEYMNNSTDGIVASWYINGKFVDSTTRGTGDTTAITAIYALWLQTNGTMTGSAYFDNIKTEIIK